MAIHPSTEVLLFNGSIKRAEDLKLHDVLVGEDSLPRKITHLEPILDEIVQLITRRRFSLVVSPKQILTLRKSPYLNHPYFYKKLGRFMWKFRKYDDMISITAGDLTNKTASFKRSFLLYKRELDYSPIEVPVDPYFLGLWLGDGHQHLPAITTMDEIIASEFCHQGRNEGLVARKYTKKGNQASTYILVNPDNRYVYKKNPLKQKLESLSLINNKHIPNVYLLNNRENRLQLLAGLIDTDGYLGYNYYSIAQKSSKLSFQICQLANSLGFNATVKPITKTIKAIGFTGNYFDVIISGRVNEIPVRLERKMIHSISEKYDRQAAGYKITLGPLCRLISIEVDSNGKFLLGNGTIIGGRTPISY